MNKEKMEQLYQNVGRQLNFIIPESWDKVLLYSEVTEWSNRTYFYYFPHNKEIPIYSLDIEDMDNVNEDEVNRQLHQLYEYLRELWDEFKNQKQEQWTNLTLELTSNGKFNIDYNYRNLENDDSYEQQVIWEYEKLGIMPNANRKRDFTIIEEYKKTKNTTK
ncbi:MULTISPECIES: immunity protein YezG family protein [Peribacillus]|uniref:immunity protein YezG family protein n=1 Tax=Peribacillus TaxID=2675229 RepID=UPI0033388B23